MIEKNLNEALVKREPSTVALLAALDHIDENNSFGNSSVYHHFPIYPTIDGTHSVNANVILLSSEHGIFIFECVEFSERMVVDYSNHINNLAGIDRLLFAKILRDCPSLQKDRRSLKVDITSAIFIVNGTEPKGQKNLSDFEFITSEQQLNKLILSQNKSKLSEIEFRELKSTIEGSRGIPRIIERNLKDPFDFANSKGAILSKIENEIYNFDLEQKRAALFVVDGAQRIRGLAGSGKTIILAMKAAIIHLQFPDANILYTYNNKSFNDYVKRLITRFYRQFAERDPDWKKIHIMHAWGGKYLEGVYSNACQFNQIPPMTFSEANMKRPESPFDFVCEILNQSNLKVQYDYSLLDEAQDFPKNFYRICRKITKNNRVIWAYDDFQNILHIELQSEKETFGKDSDGNYFIDFSKRQDQLQDLILHKCYRNPRRILISAFALGLGIYNKSKSGEYQIIQRLESNEHWESLGFEVELGDSSDNSEMVIKRPQENSSPVKNSLLEKPEILIVKRLESFDEELGFIVNSIIDDISKELKPEDISVVCMDDRYIHKYFDLIELKLIERGVKTFNLSKAPNTNTIYKVKDHVTLSTIYNAKGNEAGSVYIIGIDSVFSQKNDVTERNKIFTAMTRSLAWVTLSGIGGTVDFCRSELEELEKNNYNFIFNQPSELDVNTIRQGIDKGQKFLNRAQRLADDWSRETGLSQEDFLNMLNSKNLKK